MSRLSDKLRNGRCDWQTMATAADRIDKLERLLRAAEKWIPDTMRSHDDIMSGPTVAIKAEIRAALEEK